MNPIVTCHSLAEVRQHIDHLDRQILALIGERGAYVKQAARFKKDAAAVAAPQRVEQMIGKLKALASDYAAAPAVVEATWRAMIAAFVALEQQAHASLHTPPPSP